MRGHDLHLALSADEYETLGTVAACCGTCSVGELVHSAVTWIVSNSDRTLLELLVTGPHSVRPVRRGRWSAIPHPGRAMTRGPEARLEERDTEAAAHDTEGIWDKPERRSQHRYELQLAVRARTLGAAGGTVIGTTRNISSNGFLVVTPQPPPGETSLRVWIEWPLKSRGGADLRLTARGQVVWRTGELAGIHVKSWNFREGALPEEYATIRGAAGRVDPAQPEAILPAKS